MHDGVPGQGVLLLLRWNLSPSPSAYIHRQVQNQTKVLYILEATVYYSNKGTVCWPRGMEWARLHWLVLWTLIRSIIYHHQNVQHKRVKLYEMAVLIVTSIYVKKGGLSPLLLFGFLCVFINDDTNLVSSPVGSRGCSHNKWWNNDGWTISKINGIDMLDWRYHTVATVKAQPRCPPEKNYDGSSLFFFLG